MFTRLDYTPPSALPVSVDLVRQHATADDPSDVALFTTYVATAVELVEQYISKFLMPRQATWTLSRDFLNQPYGPVYTYSFVGSVINSWGCNRWIMMPRPATAVASVSFGHWDADVDTLTLGTDYNLDLASYNSRIRFNRFHHTAAYLQVVFTGGYATPAAIPPTIISAIMLIATKLKYNRGDGDFDVFSDAVCNLLAPYRTVTFGAQNF